MNEKQSKRLRRAQRAYVVEKRQGMEPGPRASEAAQQIVGIIRTLWARLPGHRARGRVGGRLAALDLQGAANLCVGRR